MKSTKLLNSSSLSQIPRCTILTGTNITCHTPPVVTNPLTDLVWCLLFKVSPCVLSGQSIKPVNLHNHPLAPRDAVIPLRQTHSHSIPTARGELASWNSHSYSECTKIRSGSALHGKACPIITNCQRSCVTFFYTTFYDYMSLYYYVKWL